MSITNQELIDDALRDINVISEIDSASAEQGKYALRKLNQMMASLALKEVDLGYHEQTETTAVCPIPDWAEGAITSALSFVIAPKYGASVSSELVAIGGDFMQTLLRTLIRLKLDNTDMTHLSEGAGHWGNRYSIVTDSY